MARDFSVVSPGATKTLAQRKPWVPSCESTNLYVMRNWKPAERSFPQHQALWWGPVHAYTLATVLTAAELAGYVTIANRAFVKRDRRQQIAYTKLIGLIPSCGALWLYGRAGGRRAKMWGPG